MLEALDNPRAPGPEERTDSSAADGAAGTGAPVPGGEATGTGLGEGGRADRWLGRATLGLTLAPLVVAAVALAVGVGGDYLPASDHALTELQVRDVGRHEVLVGLYSRADWSHPGPALFYLLAPFYRLAGGASVGMNLGALAINGGALAGMLLVARRHGGTPLMLTTAVGCALLVRSLGAEFVHDPWNCFVTTLPFGLALLLAWSMACGSRWALPVGVGVASCIAQAHVGFVALALPPVAAGAVALAARRLRADGDGVDPGLDGAEQDADAGWRDRLRRSGLAGPGLATLGVLAVVWAPPLVDALTNDPSNLGRVVAWFRDGEEGGHTVAEGLRTMAGQFGGDAEWLTGKATPSLGGESPFLHAAPLPWLLLPVAAAGVVLWRRGGAGRRLAVTLAGALALGVAAVARTVGPAFDYRLRWTWMVATLVVAAAAWAGVRAAAARSATAGRALVAALAATLVAVTGVNVVTAATAGTPQEGDSAVLEELLPPVLDEVSGAQGPVAVTDTYATGAWYARSVVLQLERRGVDARVPQDQEQLFGPRRVLAGEAEVTLVVAMNRYVEQLAADPSLRLVAEWSGVPAEDLEAAARERRRLDADLAAGRIDADQHAVRQWEVDTALTLEGDATAHRVAVFVREDAGR